MQAGLGLENSDAGRTEECEGGRERKSQCRSLKMENEGGRDLGSCESDEKTAAKVETGEEGEACVRARAGACSKERKSERRAGRGRKGERDPKKKASGRNPL